MHPCFFSLLARFLQPPARYGIMTSNMANRDSERKGIPLFWLVLAMVVGILILGGLNRRMADARRLTRASSQLETEVAMLETQGVGLETQVAAGASTPTVEAWARQEAKMVQPGDVLVVPIPGEAPTPAPTPEAEAPPPPPGNWEVWVALVFGK
jgi:cell division protein FtsB